MNIYKILDEMNSILTV